MHSLIRHTILAKWFQHFPSSMVNDVIGRLLKRPGAITWPTNSVSLSFALTCITFCCWMVTWSVVSWSKRNKCMHDPCTSLSSKATLCCSYVSMLSFPLTSEFPWLVCFILLRLNATFPIVFHSKTENVHVAPSPWRLNQSVTVSPSLLDKHY